MTLPPTVHRHGVTGWFNPLVCRSQVDDLLTSLRIFTFLQEIWDWGWSWDRPCGFGVAVIRCQLRWRCNIFQATSKTWHANWTGRPNSVFGWCLHWKSVQPVTTWSISALALHCSLVFSCHMVNLQVSRGCFEEAQSEASRTWVGLIRWDAPAAPKRPPPPKVAAGFIGALPAASNGGVAMGPKPWRHSLGQPPFRPCHMEWLYIYIIRHLQWYSLKVSPPLVISWFIAPYHYRYFPCKPCSYYSCKRT